MAMKCNQCTDTPATAGEVRKCSICRNDGTANEIPKDLGDEAPLALALERKPGLANRFTPIADRAAAALPSPPPPPAPAAIVQREKRKAKNKARRKKLRAKAKSRRR